MPNESYSKTEREIITGYKMANDGVDYTIVFPDALVSGEQFVIDSLARLAS